MLTRPAECRGCPLDTLSTGFMRPQIAEEYNGVTLLGEALGEEESIAGRPFVGKAGFKLTRLLEWAGFDRSNFDIFNAAWCRPPSNLLEGQPYERPSIDWCKSAHWGGLLNRAAVVVPMGNVPLASLTGRKGITKLRGYVYAGRGYHILPTVHPSFIQRGNSNYSAAFIHDIQKAIQLATYGLPPEPTDYTLDPSPAEALRWARTALAEMDVAPYRLAYDIETPGKDEDEGENDTEEGDDKTFFIYRIGFAYKPLHALSVPWTPPYMPAIRLLLESRGEKVVWNGGFDNPRIRAGGVAINGLIHDGMVAWHVLHSDLPKGLGFVATFTCPFQHEWKSLSHTSPALYNAIDADVEARSMAVIESELRKAGMWDVYKRDVLDLEPVLQHMSRAGMPVDPEVRLDRALKLEDMLVACRAEAEGLVPREVRTVSPKEGYVKDPIDTSGMVQVPWTGEVARCPVCGMQDPPKPHRDKKTLARAGTPGRKKEDRIPNPCFGAGPVAQVETLSRWARLDPLKLSRELLIRYQQHHNRFIPMKKDKKTGKRRPSMDEKGMKELIRRYPLDLLYQNVLKFRGLDKLASTYIGRPVDDSQQ